MKKLAIAIDFESLNKKVKGSLTASVVALTGHTPEKPLFGVQIITARQDDGSKDYADIDIRTQSFPLGRLSDATDAIELLHSKDTLGSYINAVTGLKVQLFSMSEKKVLNG